MEGFVQLHKKICDWEWYTDIPTKTLFLHVLLKCNYKEAKWRGIEVKPGDFITSLDHLAKETGLSVRQVRTALEHLETTGEVTKQSTSMYTILTLNNWASYNTQDDKPSTIKGQTTDKPSTTTNKEYKEKKEYKENNKTIEIKRLKDKTSEGSALYRFCDFLESLGKNLQEELKEDFADKVYVDIKGYYEKMGNTVFISEMDAFITWHTDKGTIFKDTRGRLRTWFSKK